MERLISKKILFVPCEWSIDQSLKAMIEKKVSSALVLDSHGVVAGIVTERDILRKIALLEVDRKLGRKINTIMTRPVKFVRLKNLAADVRKLHSEDGIRHFPVKKSDGEAVKENMVGIITITDLAREYLSKTSF